MPLISRTDATPQGERSVNFWLDEQPRIGVLLLHPTGGSSMASLKGGQWMSQPGVSVCAPQALGFRPDEPAAPDNPRAWSSYGGPMVGRTLDDASYLLQLASDFRQMLPPGTPLALVGHSNGCAIGFNCLLALEDHPFDLAAMYAANWAHPRPAVKRIPLLYMVGEADPIYPWADATFVRTPWFEYETVPASVTVQAWLDATGLACSALPACVQTPAGAATRWVGDEGLVFEFRVLPNQGHHWPAGLPLDPRLASVLGPNNEQLSATTMVLNFFQRQMNRDCVAAQSVAA